MERDGGELRTLEWRADHRDGEGASVAELLRSRSYAPSASVLAALAAELERSRAVATFPLEGWVGRPERSSASLRARCARALRAAVPALGRLGLSALFLYFCAFNFSVVRGSSMSPGIHDGDRILIDQVSSWFTGYGRGDIVVLRYPPDPSVEYIKRVVGLPGDEIVMAGGLVWVNGDLLLEPYVGELDPSSWSRERVRADCVYVLGDNRPHSSDSREFGQVPLENLRGKVDLCVWPPERIGWIH